MTNGSHENGLRQSFSRMVGLFIAMIPLVANADISLIAKDSVCPTLLTDVECHDYQTAMHLAKSEADRERLEARYAALLKERSRLCRCPISQNAPEETQRPRYFSGRKTSM